jgi:hypothetical protein
VRAAVTVATVTATRTTTQQYRGHPHLAVMAASVALLVGVVIVEEEARGQRRLFS